MTVTIKKETSLAEKPFYYRLLAAVMLPMFLIGTAALLLALAAVSPVVCLLGPRVITWKV